MISRERLEELIRQRATIYSTSWDEAVELSPETCTVENIKISEYGEEIGEKLFVKEDERHIPSYRLSALEEDIETEKFKKEFQNIIREEILNLPTFEELKKFERFDFKAKDGHRYTIHFISGFNTLAITGIIENKYYGEATKENYLEACKIAKKLFLGEKGND